MFIKSSVEKIQTTNFLYENRLINLTTVAAIGKSEVKIPPDCLWYTIKFTHSKSHISEWFFNNIEERDKEYNSLLKILGFNG